MVGISVATASYVLGSWVAPVLDDRYLASLGAETEDMRRFGAQTPVGITRNIRFVEANPPEEYELRASAPHRLPPNVLRWEVHAPLALAVFGVLNVFIGALAAELTIRLTRGGRRNARISATRCPMAVSRRGFVPGAGVAGAALSFGVSKHAIGRAVESAVAARQDDIWIDALGGLRFGPEGFDEIDRSGLTMIETTLGAPGDPPFGYEQAVQDIASWNGIFNRYPDRVIHVRRSADILEVKRTGGIAVMIGFQNATHLKRDLANVEFFHNLGIRQMQLTYNSLNALGAGCTERGRRGAQRLRRRGRA